MLGRGRRWINHALRDLGHRADRDFVGCRRGGATASSRIGGSGTSAPWQNEAVSPPKASAPVISEPDTGDDLADAPDDVIEAGARLEGLSLSGADVSDRRLDGLKLTNCVVSGLAFTGSTSRFVEMVDVIFRNCEFSGCTLDTARLHRVAFNGCRMAGFAMPHVEAAHVAFDDCRLNEAWFRASKLDHVRFADCDLTEADFYQAEIDCTLFVGCALSRAEFSQSRLQNVALHGSTLDGLKGGDALRSLTIGSDQALNVALPIFTALGIVIDDDFIAHWPQSAAE